MKPQVSDAKWWNERYQTGDAPWNKGAVAPPIARMIAEGVVPKGRVAVLGAGHGHEAIALAKAGYEVTAIDFAELACEAIRASAAQSGVTVDVLQGDVLALPASLRVDAALEHTCFCAIDPDRRDDYVRAMARLLVPGGRLFGLFYAHPREGGPPFKTTEAEIREKFGSTFEFERFVRAQDSFPNRAGDELEFAFRLRSW